MNQKSTEKSPASPHTTRAGGADLDGHPGRVKARRGAGANQHRTAKSAKTAKNPTALAFRPLWCSIS